jgi:hypothetical protein
MPIHLGPGLIYDSGLVSEQRPIRRTDGSYRTWTAHRAATVEEHLLARQLEWLAELLDTCGDGVTVGLITDDGKPVTLTRGTGLLGRRNAWRALLISANDQQCCPISQLPREWLRGLLGASAMTDPIYDRLPF